MIKENFIKLFETSFKENWELPAYTDYTLGTSMTYGEVALKIEKLHLLFAESKIKPGDKIALIGKNTPHWAITFVATVTYGAVIVPILQDFIQRFTYLEEYAKQHEIALSDMPLVKMEEIWQLAKKEENM